ncbi:hypothetical protein N2W54_005532 [Lotmaria passim]
MRSLSTTPTQHLRRNMNRSPPSRPCRPPSVGAEGKARVHPAHPIPPRSSSTSTAQLVPPKGGNIGA